MARVYSFPDNRACLPELYAAETKARVASLGIWSDPYYRVRRAERPAQVMSAPGCLECRMTGYYGRMGLCEVMTMTPAVRRLLTHEADEAKIREQAYRDGMKPLRVSGAQKVAAGVTTAEEVMKVAPLV